MKIRSRGGKDQLDKLGKARSSIIIYSHGDPASLFFFFLRIDINFLVEELIAHSKRIVASFNGQLIMSGQYINIINTGIL